MSLDLRAVQSTAADIARRAGAVLREAFDTPHQENTKATSIDIVTEADVASEALIVQALESAYPEHHIVGEEGGGSGTAIEKAAYRWYVDPLDGTTNFASNIPFFSVSLALADRERRPLVGVVYNPIMEELFTAARGQGAFLNGRKLHVSASDSLIRSVLVTGFPYDKATNPDNNLAEWNAFLVQVRGLRRMGSAALDLCYVAAGRFDGMWEQRLNSWDMLAGLLCVEEAGGRASDYQGAMEMLYSGQQVVATNGRIHNAMLEILAKARAPFAPNPS